MLDVAREILENSFWDVFPDFSIWELGDPWESYMCGNLACGAFFKKVLREIDASGNRRKLEKITIREKRFAGFFHRGKRSD